MSGELSSTDCSASGDDAFRLDEAPAPAICDKVDTLRFIVFDRSCESLL